MQPGIRPAIDKDLPILQALARRTIDTCYRPFLGDEAVDWLVKSGASDTHIKTQLEHFDVYCLGDVDNVLAFSILEGPTIDLMMVDPGHHRHGLGRRLLDHAEKTLFTQHKVIRLENFQANQGGNAFLEANAWKPAGLLEGAEGPPKVEYTKANPAP